MALLAAATPGCETHRCGWLGNYFWPPRDLRRAKKSQSPLVRIKHAKQKIIAAQEKSAHTQPASDFFASPVLLSVPAWHEALIYLTNSQRQRLCITRANGIKRPVFANATCLREALQRHNGGNEAAGATTSERSVVRSETDDAGSKRPCSRTSTKHSWGHD